MTDRQTLKHRYVSEGLWFACAHARSVYDIPWVYVETRIE